MGVTQTAIPAARPAGHAPGPPHGIPARTVAADNRAVKALRAGWTKKKAEIFAGKYHIPDCEDSDTVNHLNWYEATNFKRPYPGEKKVRPASDFNRRRAPAKADPDDDDDAI